MADYNYDESGSMAAYFLLTFLLVILIPLTISSPASLSAYSTALSTCAMYLQVNTLSRAETCEGRMSVSAMRESSFEFTTRPLQPQTPEKVCRICLPI